LQNESDNWTCSIKKWVPIRPNILVFFQVHNVFHERHSMFKKKNPTIPLFPISSEVVNKNQSLCSLSSLNLSSLVLPRTSELFT
jgi:hypothetical protein